MTNPAGYNVPNVQKPDGTWELGGTVNFLSTGTVQVDGATVTPADALVGVTASSDEINLNDGAVAGTSVASKTLALGANKETDVLALPVSGLKIGAGAGTAMSASAAELNVNTGVVAGTASASKTAVLGANKNLDVLAVADLKLGAGAGTSVTSTAAEINTLAGVTGGTVSASKALVVNAASHLDAVKTTALSIGASGSAVLVSATAAELNEVDDITSHAQSTIAVAVEGGDSIDVTVTLKDAAGVAVDEARFVKCWLSSSATTGAIYTDGGITVTASTGSLLKEDTDDLLFQAVTSTAGVLVLNIAGSGDQAACYLWVQMPNGKSKVSAAIDLAA